LTELTFEPSIICAIGQAYRYVRAMVIRFGLPNVLIVGALASNHEFRCAISWSKRRAAAIVVHFWRVFYGGALLTTIFSNGAYPDFSEVAEHAGLEV
jgi:hypothetical protein